MLCDNDALSLRCLLLSQSYQRVNVVRVFGVWLALSLVELKWNYDLFTRRKYWQELSKNIKSRRDFMEIVEYVSIPTLSLSLLCYLYSIWYQVIDDIKALSISSSPLFSFSHIHSRFIQRQRWLKGEQIFAHINTRMLSTQHFLHSHFFFLLLGVRLPLGFCVRNRKKTTRVTTTENGLNWAKWKSLYVVICSNERSDTKKTR